MENKVESGVQLFQRISSRPNISGLHPIILNNIKDVPTIVEISEDDCGVKRGFVIELLLRSILPDAYLSGKDCGTILINTEHHFSLVHFVSLLKRIIKGTLKDKNNVNKVVESCLDKLIVLNCYSDQQLHMTIFNIENILLSNINIGLILLDSLSGFYWEEKMASDINFVSMQNHCLKLFNSIYTIVKEFNVSFIFGNQYFEDNLAISRAIKEKKYLENYHKITFYREKTKLNAKVWTVNEAKIYTCQTGDVFTFL